MTPRDVAGVTRGLGYLRVLAWLDVHIYLKKAS